MVMTRDKFNSACFTSLLCFVLAFCIAILKRANHKRTQSSASFRTLSAEELLTKVQGRQPVFFDRLSAGVKNYLRVFT
jgi:hypothetical protein